MVHIRLTQKGLELSRSLKFEPFEVFRDAFSAALTHDELMQLLSLLDKLVTFVRTQVAAKAEARSAAK